MQRRRHLRPHVPAAVFITLALTLVEAASAGNGYAVRNGSIAAGGDIVRSGCLTVHSTVGEPVAGAVSAGGFSVTSGFQAVHDGAQVADRIFKNGFDQGNCSP